MMFLVFIAAFIEVCCLGLNSKLCRDDKILGAFCVSWLITCSKFVFVWTIAEAGLSPWEFLFAAGLGGSLGITFAQYLYLWYDKRSVK